MLPGFFYVLIPRVPSRIQLEVAVASLDGAITAQQNGADRLELNSALELGGLTHTHGLVYETLRAVSIPDIVMLRPRPGGFVYSPSDFTPLQRDADHALTQGAAGIAFGFLTPDREIDLDRTRQLIRQAASAQSVFHRAFDLLPDLIQGVDQLIDLGVTRVLTSGGQTTALEGAATIAQLLQHARGRIEILPGAGIRAENAPELLTRTGCDQIHGSFSARHDQECDPVARGSFAMTDAPQIRAVRAILDNYSPPSP